MTDVTVTNHGSVVGFRPITKEAKEWFNENVQSEDWQWMGHTLFIDRRYAESLVEGLAEAGLTVE